MSYSLIQPPFTLRFREMSKLELTEHAATEVAMSYFRLVDDVHVRDRWHLGEVTSVDGFEPRLLAGTRVERAVELRASITRAGRPLDFCLTTFAVPVASEALANVIAEVAGMEVQLIPVEIEGHRYAVVNATRCIDCLDENRSVFTKWTVHDHRSDLAGEYRSVPSLRIDLAHVPRNAKIFRIARWGALVVSSDVRDAMLATGCLGAKFIDVT